MQKIAAHFKTFEKAEVIFHFFPEIPKRDVEICESREEENGEIQVFPSEEVMEQRAEKTFTEVLHCVVATSGKRVLYEFVACLARQGDTDVFSEFRTCFGAAGLTEKEMSECIGESREDTVQTEKALFERLGLESHGTAYMINNRFLLRNQTPEQAIELFHILNREER